MFNGQIKASHQLINFYKKFELKLVIIKRKETNFNEKLEKKFNQTINKLVSKIDNSISSFRFNVTIAHFYELYNFFKDNLDKEISNKVLKDSIMKIMKLMIPLFLILRMNV